jgi:hypothetical protein
MPFQRVFPFNERRKTMSQNHSLQTLETLHDENRRLNAQVVQLQNRLARYEELEEAEDADQWNVWPYCWILAAAEVCTERFHSFHGKLIDARLSRRNLRARRDYEMKCADESRVLRLL